MSGYVSELPIVKDIGEVGEGFSEGVSLSTFTAAGNIGMSALGAFLDPLAWVVGQLMEPIYNWIINNVTFVKETLNAFLGNPEAIATTGTCTEQNGMNVEQRAAVGTATIAVLGGAWASATSPAIFAGLTMWGHVQEKLAQVLQACGVGIRAIAGVVDMVKQFIIGLGKELINELISKAVMSVLASFVTFGAAYAAYTAWAAGKVAWVAAKFSGLLQKLCTWGAGKAETGSKLQKALLAAAEGLRKIKNRQMTQSMQGDLAWEFYKQEQGQINGLNSAASAPMSEASHYGTQAQQRAQELPDLINGVAPQGVGPGKGTSAGTGAVNDAAGNDDDRQDAARP